MKSQNYFYSSVYLLCITYITNFIYSDRVQLNKREVSNEGRDCMRIQKELYDDPIEALKRRKEWYFIILYIDLEMIR